MTAEHRVSYEQSHARLIAYMRCNGMKLTRQRELILEIFLLSGKHVAVEELLALVKSRDPSVGHATVYRTMKLLVASGIAAERRFSDGVSCYEPASLDEQHHDHLICTRCRKIVEFHNEQIEELQLLVALEQGFDLTHHRMELYGICGDCR